MPADLSPSVDATPVERVSGYAKIRDYAIIGDGRTAALVARDGAIDWLPLPNLDSPSIFGAVIDARRAGAFQLAPATAFRASRRYLPDTNVLETVFETASGRVRVTDAMTLPGRDALPPLREIVRRVEGLSGTVTMRWRVEPRPGYGGWPVRFEYRDGIPVACARSQAVAVRSWGAGTATISGAAIAGEFEASAGRTGLLAFVAADQEPLVFSLRQEAESRLERTIEFWRSWVATTGYAGPWGEAVSRSALALKLLVYAPSGAVAAAPTTSIPEVVGGERNWDYRYCWIRDTAFTLDALLQLGFHDEAQAFFWWFMHATRLTHPRLQVLYRLDGAAHVPERELPLDGYRGSRPVRIGNGAAQQEQLDLYGDLLHTCWLYAMRGYEIDRDTGRALAEIGDVVCRIWRRPDRGIWEVRMAPRHFTHSKAMCWVALDRAIALADGGVLPRRHAGAWRDEATAIRAFIEERCWSEHLGSYVRYAGSEELDASLLLMAVLGYGHARDPRLLATIEAIRRGLAEGPLVLRYRGEDGLAGREGYFLCCSFWLVHALAVVGELGEARRLMEQLLALANDVGLYAEEIDPDGDAFLGNFPQGLVHLALINAALAVNQAAGGSRQPSGRGK